MFTSDAQKDTNDIVEIVRKCLNGHINSEELNSGLDVACWHEHIEIVRLLLKKCEVGFADNLFLRRASGKGHTEIVRLLLTMPTMVQ